MSPRKKIGGRECAGQCRESQGRDAGRMTKSEWRMTIQRASSECGLLRELGTRAALRRKVFVRLADTRPQICRIVIRHSGFVILPHGPQNVYAFLNALIIEQKNRLLTP
jgi:hypothetical protein